MEDTQTCSHANIFFTLNAMPNLSEKKLFVIFFKLWIILSNAYLIFFCCLTIICKMISCMELLIIYQSLFSCRNSHLFVHYNGWTCHFTPAVFNFICLLKVLEICTQIVHTYAYLYFSMKKNGNKVLSRLYFLATTHPPTSLYHTGSVRLFEPSSFVPFN